MCCSKITDIFIPVIFSLDVYIYIVSLYSFIFIYLFFIFTIYAKGIEKKIQFSDTILCSIQKFNILADKNILQTLKAFVRNLMYFYLKRKKKLIGTWLLILWLQTFNREMTLDKLKWISVKFLIKKI